LHQALRAETTEEIQKRGRWDGIGITHDLLPGRLIEILTCGVSGLIRVGLPLVADLLTFLVTGAFLTIGTTSSDQSAGSEEHTDSDSVVHAYGLPANRPRARSSTSVSILVSNLHLYQLRRTATPSIP
jgi:hypothetical protein